MSILEINIENSTKSDFVKYMKNSITKYYGENNVVFLPAKDGFLYLQKTNESYNPDIIKHDGVSITIVSEENKITVTISCEDVFKARKAFSLVNGYYVISTYDNRITKKEDADDNTETIWTNGDVSIIFNKGRMEYFNHTKVEAKSMNDVEHFYYDMEIIQKTTSNYKRKVYSTYEFPKVQDLGSVIDDITSFDMKNKGYLLYQDEENTDEYYDRTFYTQVELCDLLWLEQFIRIERYDHDFKNEGENPQYNSQYKMTVGCMSSSSEIEAGDCFLFNYLKKEELIRLKDVANQFVKKTLEQ